LKNKLDTFEIFLNDSNYDIICINEHWCTDNEINLYIPNGYKLASSFCRTHLGHGGVALYIKNEFKLSYEHVDLGHFCEEKQFEAAAIILPQPKICILTVYRTPDSNINTFIERLEECIYFLNTLSKNKHFKFVISGDFNIDPRNVDAKTNYFLNMLRSCDLFPLNKLPTRQDSCLDNFISNLQLNYVNCKVIQPHISDHCGLSLVINFGKDDSYRPIEINNIEEVVNIRLLSDSNIHSLKLRLSSYNWLNTFPTCKNFNEAFDLFIKILCYELSICCPVKQKTKTKTSRDSRKKWFTPNLNNIRSLLYSSYEKAKANPCFKKQYTDLKKLYRTQVTLAKKQANENYITKAQNKCRAAWTVINSEIGRIPKTTNHKTTSISADEFNDFFINVGQNLRNSVNDTAAKPIDILHSANIVNQNIGGFDWNSINMNDVSRIINKLSNSKTEDVYGFSNYIIKKLNSTLLYPLTYLINWMFRDGTYPQCLKLTVTIPVFKKGDRNEKSNYRPISLVPVLSKIVERVMKNQLEIYFEVNSLLSPSQFGFRKGLTTVKAVEKVITYVLNNFEAKQETTAVLLDLSKAFDVVPHKVLIKKLKYYCKEKNSLLLLESYLSNRQQFVKIGEQRSKLLKVTSGVPQGSVLGPFLFIVYVNDLQSFIPNECLLYADDTTLLTSNKDSSLNEVVKNYMIERSHLWFCSNELTINHDKTEEIIFSLSLSENKTVKLLGINLDTSLNWNSHSQNLCKRLSRVIFLLSKLKKCTGFNLVLSAYHAFFHSHLLYGVTLWGNSPGAKLVFRWQKKAIRCMKGINRTDSCRPFFAELGILPLPCIYILHCLIYVKERLHDFDMRNDYHQHNTRFNNQIDTRFVRLSKTQNSFKYVGVKLFNKLPVTARSISTITFTKVLVRWLRAKCFYSIGEFECSNMNDLIF
jgi:hypothetical protein